MGSGSQEAEFRMIRLNFFFFQAEDGIRDVAVTGVQTCALPIYPDRRRPRARRPARRHLLSPAAAGADRKSTRLNSSHGYISYAVFCLKKKNKPTYDAPTASIIARPHDTPISAAARSAPLHSTMP